MHKSFLSISGIIILGVILLLVNGISDRVFSRFFVDLTDEKLYSLSDGTDRILDSLEEPITLRYYFSKTDGSRYPAVKLYGTRVLDLLKQYERASKGNIVLEVHDPRPDTEEEEWAQKYGLTPMALPTGERLFFGLAGFNTVGDEDAIPLFDMRRQQFLEYDITKLIYALNVSKRPVLGIISSLDVKGAPAQPAMPGRPPMPGQSWILVNQLSKVAEVKFLEKNIDVVPDDVDVLMVIHPKNFSEQALYAIDQFAVKGGNLFVAVDPYCETDRPQPDPQNPYAAMGADRSSNMPRLLSAWGAELIEKKIVGDINLATKVSPGRGQPPVNFLMWMTLADSADSAKGVVNREDIVSSQLESAMLAWSGALKLTEVEGITSETIFRTTPAAMLFSDTDVRFGGGNPQEMLKKYIRGSKAQVLAVRLQGKLKSSFDKKPGDEEKKEESMSSVDGHLAEGGTPSNIIVVADVDFLADGFSAQSQNILGTQLISLLNDNLIFAANAIENLAGSDDLIGLRSRGKFSRPFTKVQEIEANAQDKWKLEEMRLQGKLNQANQRLNQLQNSTGGDGKKVFTKALLGELQTFRDERREAQQRLREVRRKLREDKELWGTMLFVANTFFIPAVLILGSLVVLVIRNRRRKSEESA